MSARRQSRLFDASGEVRALRASPLLAIGPAEPGPALRRGVVVAVPIAVSLAFEFSLGFPSRGAIATGAVICGFTALDAPAGPRAAWQAAVAPLVGLGAALGVLSSQWAPAAVLAMGLVGVAAGYCMADTLRLAFGGFAVALALMISQGLFLPAHDALPALLYGTLGGLIQAIWAAIIWLVYDRAADQKETGWDPARIKDRLRSNLTLDSPYGRHALRFGAALALGVAIYRIAGMREHGYWIPLTILFVLRPELEETDRRLVLRAVGTVLGIVVATALASLYDGAQPWIAITLSVAAALSFGLLTVQYALFTAAITTYVVLLSDTLGEARVDAAGQRLLGTAVGILIVFVAIRAFPEMRSHFRSDTDH